MRCIRTQTDSKGDAISKKTVLDCSKSPDRARQEFGPEADISFQLSRYGIGTPTRPMQYGTEVDDNLDLQRAISAVGDAQQSYYNLPENLRELYVNWMDFAQCAATGRLRVPKEKPAAQAAAPAEPVAPEPSPPAGDPPQRQV